MSGKVSGMGRGGGGSRSIAVTAVGGGGSRSTAVSTVGGGGVGQLQCQL